MKNYRHLLLSKIADTLISDPNIELQSEIEKAKQSLIKEDPLQTSDVKFKPKSETIELIKSIEKNNLNYYNTLEGTLKYIKELVTELLSSQDIYLFKQESHKDLYPNAYEYNMHNYLKFPQTVLMQWSQFAPLKYKNKLETLNLNLINLISAIENREAKIIPQLSADIIYQINSVFGILHKMKAYKEKDILDPRNVLQPTISFQPDKLTTQQEISSELEGINKNLYFYLSDKLEEFDLTDFLYETLGFINSKLLNKLMLKLSSFTDEELLTMDPSNLLDDSIDAISDEQEDSFEMPPKFKNFFGKILENYIKNIKTEKLSINYRKYVFNQIIKL